jgi:hypothetical protein
MPENAMGSGPAPGTPVSPAEIVAAIRAESAATRLVTKAELEKRFPGSDIAATLYEAVDSADVLVIEGSRADYYFSSLSMTENYATYLARLAENDPLRLVADTVRDESRIYPRTTALSTFAEAPFLMPPWKVREIVDRLAGNPEFSDIQSCAASNGAVYLYSTQYLDRAYAEGLTEWNEVGKAMNP